MAAITARLRIAASVVAPWQFHKTKWKGCTRCPLHKFALCQVLVRGRLPCEVLFIGEAPGTNEDAEGYPFVGRAGKILDALIDDSFTRFRPYEYAITNVVACKPFAGGEEITPPPAEAVEACQPRLTSLINNIATPDLVILLGKVAETSLPLSFQKTTVVPKERWVALQHPSYIARRGGLDSLEFKRNTLALTRYLKGNLGA